MIINCAVFYVLFTSLSGSVRLILVVSEILVLHNAFSVEGIKFYINCRYLIKILCPSYARSYASVIPSAFISIIGKSVLRAIPI